MFKDRMKLKPFLLICFAIMSLMVIPLIGCGGGGDGWGGVEVQPPSQPPSQPPPPATTADIGVSRTQIAFGDVVMDHYSDQMISVQNTGSAYLNIGQIVKANSSSPFTVLNDNCSLGSFAPGGTCTFQIRFSPSSQGAFNDVYNIPSNDPDAAENPVVLNVSGYGRSLYVSINQIDTSSCSSSRIRLLISVTDQNANPLTGLLGDHLSLLENALPRNIEAFYQLMEPISVAMMLDYSGSIFDANMVTEMETAAKNLIDRLNPNIGDEASIIKYSDTYSLIQAFTTDKIALKTAIDSQFAGSYGDTALYDTLWFGMDETAARTNRRAVVVITDGRDNVSQKTLTEVITKAKGDGIPLFTIGVADADVAVLQQLADETGGSYFFARTADDFNLIYLQIADILVGQYVLEYMSQSSGGNSITLDLEANFNGMTGRTAKSFSGCP